MSLVADAARNNAEWCDAYCRAHGVPGTFGDLLWSSARRTPPFYPDAVTLQPRVAADAVLRAVDAGEGCSVKDSFADLDLTAASFAVLFEAEWIALERASAAPGWEVVPGEVRSPVVAYLRGPDAAAVANRSERVIGLSNVEARDVEAAYAGAAGLAQTLFGPLPVVGYDRSEALDAAHAAGFVSLASLRVWARRRRA